MATSKVNYFGKIKILYYGIYYSTPLIFYNRFGIGEISFADIVGMAALNSRLPFDDFIEGVFNAFNRGVR